MPLERDMDEKSPLKLPLIKYPIRVKVFSLVVPFLMGCAYMTREVKFRGILGSKKKKFKNKVEHTTQSSRAFMNLIMCITSNRKKK